ncbi:MAG: hypothetical protein RSE27_08150, partial [Ruthenibacterium sp.]
MNLKGVVADYTSFSATAYRRYYKSEPLCEETLLKYFPAEIESTPGYIQGFEKDIQTVAAHPQIEEGFCGMEISGKTYTEKVDASEIILAVCKEM